MDYAITEPQKLLELKRRAQDCFEKGYTFNQVYVQGYSDAISESNQLRDIAIPIEDLIVARMYIEDEIAKHPGCNELQTISRVLACVKKRCPKGRDTRTTCYEMCPYRENGLCTLDDK